MTFIILITDENESINLVISKNIKSALPFVSELNITSKINVQNYNMEDYDVVFTTEDQAYVTHKNNNTITIKPTFSSLEIITLINQKYHEEIFSEMIGNVNDGFGSFHMSVPEENFFILYEKTYASGLNQMLKRLTDLNQINEESIGSLMERENSNPSYFSNNLAFPHIVNTNKDRFVLSIGVFENPVQIDDRSVSVIVLLLVPDDETMSSHMITIYDELIKVFHNKQYIESISLVNSFSDFNALTTN